MKFTVFILIFGSSFSCSKNKKTESQIITTQFFEIHNNYWINLHHFIYQKAKGSQLKKIQEDGGVFSSIGEENIYEKLSSNDSRIIEDAVSYYKDSLIDRSLLFELGDLRVWLQQQHKDTLITDTTFSKTYTDVLNNVSSVYKRTFWSIHQSHNEKVLNQHLELIRDLESDVIKEMELLSQDVWPTQTKVRLDISTYANWAGAYTPTRPKMNIILSTIRQDTFDSSLTEVIFHEGSHLLFSSKGPFRSRIFQLSEELEIDFPRHLWHASQFYLCGRVIQDKLKEKGIKHTMVMEDRNIFSRYNTPNFKESLEKYYKRESNLEETVRSLLNEMKK